MLSASMADAPASSSDAPTEVVVVVDRAVVVVTAGAVVGAEVTAVVAEEATVVVAEEATVVVVEEATVVVVGVPPLLTFRFVPRFTAGRFAPIDDEEVPRTTESP